MGLKVGNWLKELGPSGTIASIGAIVLAPIVIPAVAKASKPLAKAAIKGGILVYTKGRTMIAETGEVIEDLVAEVQAELAEEQEQQDFETTEAEVSPD